jgi:hypothetical protein
MDMKSKEFAMESEEGEEFVMKSENFAHPDKFFPGRLIYHKYGDPLPEEVKKDRCDLDKGSRKEKNQELCWSCGWKGYMQFTSSYASRLKILSTQANTGTWALGSNWILKDMPNDGTTPGNDYMTQKFLRSQLGSCSDVPLCREMQLINLPTEKTYLLLMNRVEGQTLAKVWFKLSEEEQEGIRDQVYRFLVQIRKFTANTPQNTEGGKLDDMIIGKCRTVRPKCKKIGSTTEEWFNNIAEELRVGLGRIHKTSDATVIERELQKLKDDFPKPEPYVLTHGDLTFGNLMVKDAKVTAIIDFELSGYYPWWAEWYMSRAFGADSCNAWWPIWPRIEPCMDSKTFHTEVGSKIDAVRAAWDACERHIKHPGYYDKLLRPPFSKDQVWAGAFRVGQMGGVSEREHIIET